MELTIEPTELDVSVFTGKEKVVNITCTASSPVVVIMWSINGTTVTSDVADITNTVVDNKMLSTLTLKRPTPRMSGRYICHIPFLISDTSCTVRIRGMCVCLFVCCVCVLCCVACIHLCTSFNIQLFCQQLRYSFSHSPKRLKLQLGIMSL